MGVLTDDDIVKINETLDKRKISKIFYDPKKSQTLFFVMYAIVLVAVMGVVVAGLGMSTTIEGLTEWHKVYNGLESSVLDNSSCETLITIYKDSRNNVDLLPSTKQLIKDEISFRC